MKDGLCIRWDKQDLRDSFPFRFKKVLEEYGTSAGTLTRAFWRSFTEQQEKEGPLHIKRVIKSVNRRAAQKGHDE